MDSEEVEPVMTAPAMEVVGEEPAYAWYEHVPGTAPVHLYSITAPFSRHFTRGIKVSPDGLCLLSNADDNTMRLFEVNPSVTEAALEMPEGGTIYDFNWYPFMNSADPATCVFATTTHAHPIHLWDAYTGELRATYRAYDHLDELTSAYSVAFNATGDKLFAGFDRTIRIFDTAQPSRDFTTRALSKTRKSRAGQRGIIASLHFNPDHSKMYAAGSYSGQTCIYAEDSGEEYLRLEGHDGQGITQVQFSPDGKYLLTGARKHNAVLVWDIRHTMQVLHQLPRQCPTNQRIAFDIHCGGRYVATGSEDKRVLLYDLLTGDCVNEIAGFSDAVNGVSFFPSGTTAQLASCTGQRHYEVPEDMCDDEARAKPAHGVHLHEFHA
ncbi:hypothetical protein ACHHYP_14198 [Achlya hypogyna]|uniref:Uncharacterized protein n=1 Tax=Achlya hypogyna TaxID=1202772 RepID=A0A1V9YDN8_ACHHY|nr:hypothetical protein ACHHYP_14198 [Achlya hypogyna]